MTAPDPGLTDLIAAHLTELIADAPEEDNYDAGYVAALADLRDSAAFKLVVEQHTNGRTVEPETTSEGGNRWYVNGYASVEFDAACDIWLNEVDPYVGDSGHARKLAAALHAAATAAAEPSAQLWKGNSNERD